MDNEVDPQVLTVLNEKRLSGPRLNPVEIVEKMGVLAAREKPFDHAWLAGDGSVIATIWAEYITVGTSRWFYLESLDTRFRAGGGARSPNQVQRAKDRLALLKRTFDSEQTFRVVLQTNRVAIEELESNKNAKVSTRVRDDDQWHVAAWEPQQGLAVLVRGPRGWAPSTAEVQAARTRRSVPNAPPQDRTVVAAPVSGEDPRAAALAYVTRHFTGYGYGAKDVSTQGLGYDIEVSSQKGEALLRVVVKGTSAEAPRFRLSSEERKCSTREKLWRLLVVSDALGPAAQHKIYKPTEVAQAPGFEESE